MPGILHTWLTHTKTMMLLTQNAVKGKTKLDNTFVVREVVRN